MAYGDMDPGNPTGEFVKDSLGGLSSDSSRKLSNVLSAAYDLVGADAVQGIANPFGRDCLVSVAIDITTAGTGTVDVGVAASESTTGDNLIDAGSLAAVGVLSSGEGTNGEHWRKLAVGQYVTYDASAAQPNLAGRIYLICIPIGE